MRATIRRLRQQLISEPILRAYRQLAPRMSETERDALEAGTVWWEKQLFSGRPDWTRLLDAPVAALSSEEQAFLDGPVEDLCHVLDDWQITHELWDLPYEAWRLMKDKGFFGMIIPKRYGGLEFSASAHSAVVMKVASRSVSAAVTVMVPNSLGPAELLLRYGTEPQRQHYLPRLARGADIPCFALTGPDAGSDASSIPDSGVVCRGNFDGKPDVLGIRLNFRKRYITLAPVATVLGLAFKLYDPEHLLGGEEVRGITLALIPTTTAGIAIGRRHNPLDQAFQNGPVEGRDVVIPLDWVIGGEQRIGHGWRMLMDCLAAGRSVSLPALGTGAGKLACRATGAYARVRKQFKLPIGRFEGVEEALARIAGYTYLMDAARRFTTWALDQGEKPAVASAIVKYQLTEHMRRVVNDAMDVQGGAGIIMGPRNFMGRVYQAVPISITVEGANILTRSFIIFGQGALRCHPYALRELQAAANPNPQRALDEFDSALWAHARHILANLARSMWLGLTDGRTARAPVTGPLHRHCQRITRMSAAFALISDAAMLVLGGSLKRREKLSGRLADVLSFLYLASATVKQFADQGHPESDRPLLDWTMSYALHQVQDAIDGLLRNFPNRAVAGVLRVLIFPRGRCYAPPEDVLGRRLAELLLEPSATRDRLTGGVFISSDPNDPVGRIEHAFASAVAAEPVEQRLREAVRSGQLTAATDEAMLTAALSCGVITEQEADLIRRTDAARQDVIQVDDFPPHTTLEQDTLWAEKRQRQATRGPSTWWTAAVHRS